MEPEKIVEKGEKIEINIEDMSSDGAGIGKYRGIVIFVDDAVYGDKVLCEITKVKKKYCFAKFLKLISASKYRREGHCRYEKECGGCTYFALNYEGQVQLKEKQIRDKLERIGGFSNFEMDEIVRMKDTEGYRNKATCMISTGGIVTKKGGLVESIGNPMVGFFVKNSHVICDCMECRIQCDTVNVIADTVREFMRQDNISGYDPKWDKGLLRKVVIKTGYYSGDVMVIFFINGKGIPNHEKLIGMLDDAIYSMPPDSNGTEYSLESVIIARERNKSGKENNKSADKYGNLGSFNIDMSNMEYITLAGKPTIYDKIGDLIFEISPGAFYQINTVQTRHLYDKVLEYAGPKGDENVWDLYCGVGSIGLYMASSVKSVLGIEIVKSAVMDANRNAVINGITNAVYRCADVKHEILSLIQNGEKCDIAILDPPRAGCDEDIIRSLADIEVKKIVYVSCDPGTLARDLKIFREVGYNVDRVGSVDMFPETRHVECVVLLTKVHN